MAKNLSIKTKRNPGVAGREVSDVDRVEAELREQIGGLGGVEGAMLPRQEDLAKRLGVSRRAVRDAIGRLKKVGIVESVRGKGAFIASAAGKAKGDVHIVARNLFHPYEMMCVAVLTDLLAARGQRQRLLVTDDLGEEIGLLASDTSAAGIFLISPYRASDIRGLVRACSAPVVSTSDTDESYRQPPACDTVLPNMQAVGLRCIEHLAAAGHTRIAFADFKLERPSVKECLQGYRSGLEAVGLEYRQEYVVEMPSLSFGPGVGDEIYHGPLGAVQQQINKWFDEGPAPTALIHAAASEVQMRDMLELYFRDHFKPDGVVARVHAERVRSSYGGMRGATAISMKYESLASRALELMDKARLGEPPVRELHEQIFVYRRVEGVWMAESPALPAEGPDSPRKKIDAEGSYVAVQ